MYPSAAITIAELGARLEISSDFPRISMARIRVACEKPQSFTLSLRVPAWARSLKVTCDGTPIESDGTGRRVAVTRSWGSLERH